MRLLSRSLLSLALSSPLLAHGAGSVELRVIGTIKPGACTPVISGNVDYGIIANDWADLTLASGTQANPTAVVAAAGANTKTLPTRSVALSINCTAAIPVAIVVRDNKPASKLQGLAAKAPPGATEDSMFSLDATNDNKHGAFHLAMRSASAGGAPVDMITSPVGARIEWSRNNSGAMATGQLLSWASSGTLQPGAWTSISGTLEVTPVLTGNLDRSQDIQLNGSATIEIRYL